MTENNTSGDAATLSTQGSGTISFPVDRCIRIENFDDGGLTTGSRDIEIYLPKGYEQSADHYQVVYFNDGHTVLSYHQWDLLNVDLAYDKLIAEDLIKPAIFVAISNPGAGAEERIRDYTPTELGGPLGGVYPNGGGLDGYYKFISQRLKPYIDSNYRTKPEPAATGVAGFSAGGLAAFLMAYEHPETFGMSGCMSPSLWWDDEYAINLVRDAHSGKKSIRFWLDTAGAEHGWVWISRAYGLLEQCGWIPGDDLAAYFDYPANHSWQAARGRTRDMLYFLLRKDPLQLIEYRLVYAANPTAPVMDLNTRNHRIIGAEAWYENGLRLTVPQPGITIDNTSVVTLDSDDPFLLQGAGPGETTISSTYLGHQASLRVIGYHTDISESYLVCPASTSMPQGGGDAADWLNLPHAIIGETRNTVARFGVSHDACHVHIAIHVLDEAVITDPDTNPGDQDSIGIMFDGRSEQHLIKGDGHNWEDDAQDLCVCMSPGQPGEPFSINSRGVKCPPGSDEWVRIMPADTQVACVVAPGGYNGTLSIPISYLEEKQGGSWRVFRLNFWINSLDKAGDPVVETWWQPHWITFQNLVGAGIFLRDERFQAGISTH